MNQHYIGTISYQQIWKLGIGRQKEELLKFYLVAVVTFIAAIPMAIGHNIDKIPFIVRSTFLPDFEFLYQWLIRY
jgi:hypothetical protein